jgi:hypothetical protein
MDTPPKFEHGTVSPNVSVEHSIIRVMSDSDDPNQELRLQGASKTSASMRSTTLSVTFRILAQTGVSWAWTFLPLPSWTILIRAR